MKNKKYASAATIAVAMASIAIAAPTFAQTTPAPTTMAPTAQMAGHQGWGGKGGMGMGMMGKGGMGMRGVHGTVSAISGNTITITETNPKDSTTQTYTVDATNAKVMKDGAVSTVSAIAVGDTVMADGTTNGTSVTAKMVFDGKMMARPMGMATGTGPGTMNSMSAITGDGQPVIVGTVTTVSGSTITLTNKSNATYTIDATNAKFTKMGATNATIANVTTGDTVLVQGGINGNSVTATSVIDQGVAPAASTSTSGAPAPQKVGFLSRISSFFSHLF